MVPSRAQRPHRGKPALDIEFSVLANPSRRDLLLNHPRQKILRTGPTCSTVADLEVLEQANFDGWVKAVYRKYERRELNHFEHNLGVGSIMCCT